MSKALMPCTGRPFFTQTPKSKILQNSKLRSNITLVEKSTSDIMLKFCFMHKNVYYTELFFSYVHMIVIKHILHLDLSSSPRNSILYICSNIIQSKNIWNTFDPKYFGYETPNLSSNDDLFLDVTKKGKRRKNTGLWPGTKSRFILSFYGCHLVHTGSPNPWVSEDLHPS